MFLQNQNKKKKIKNNLSKQEILSGPYSYLAQPEKQSPKQGFSYNQPKPRPINSLG